MNASTLDWQMLIKEAQNFHESGAPIHLLALLDSWENPFAIEPQQHDAYLTAYHLDIGHINRLCNAGHPVSAEDRACSIASLSWLLSTLEDTSTSSPNPTLLATILIVSQAFSSIVSIWQHVPIMLFNTNLAASMASFVGSAQLQFRSVGQHIPIWENEIMSGFHRADEEEDWPKVAHYWSSISSALRSEHLLSAATSYLCATIQGRKALAFVIDRFSSILPIMGIANTLTSLQLGEVARLLKSNRGRFALIQTLSFNFRRGTTLPEDVIEDIASVFRQVQQNASEWQKWATAFNRFPVRSQSLQASFGRSLANSDNCAKLAYVSAIELDTTRSECRASVTECLKNFSDLAHSIERQDFWQIIHDQWVKWNFGIHDLNASLTSIAVCQLDYGLIGFAIENLSEQELEEALQSVQYEMSNISKNWFDSVIERNSAWYCALSKWQILTYASQIKSGNAQWELPASIYLPFDPDKDEFLALSYPTNTY